MTHPREADEARIVTDLAERMRAKLAIRRHHGHWRGLPVGEIQYRLIAETHELNNAIDVLFNDPDFGETNRESVISEAVDVAAYCAMLIDVLSKVGAE